MSFWLTSLTPLVHDHEFKHRSWHIHEAILIALLLGFLGERARDNSVPEGRGEVLRFCTAASALLIHYSHHSETLYIASLFTSYCPPLVVSTHVHYSVITMRKDTLLLRHYMEYLIRSIPVRI